jgi:hypothetical protein
MGDIQKNLYFERLVYVMNLKKDIQYSVDSRIGWFIQEMPSLLIPLIAYYRMYDMSWNTMRFCAVSLFVLHYFQR